MIRLRFSKILSMAEGETALEIDAEIRDGSVTTIYGKSGAGKTSLLRILAGLLKPDEGYIEVDSEVWLDTKKGISVPVQKRKTGFVFQDFALFPNMTVAENLRYAASRKNSDGFMQELLDMVSLEQLADRKPDTLSGGQKQRVALIRALIREPRILLLDEPLSALDAEMRSVLREEIYQLHKKFNLTTLLVSHDMGEIYRLSDHVIHIDKGKIIDTGTPHDVFGASRLSSKIQLTAEVLRIIHTDVVNVVEVLIGNTIVKVIATDEEVSDLNIGDKVMLFSKAFNPMIRKIG